MHCFVSDKCYSKENHEKSRAIMSPAWEIMRRERERKGERGDLEATVSFPHYILSSSLHSWSRGPSCDSSVPVLTDCTCTCTTTVCASTTPTTACACRVQVRCVTQTCTTCACTCITTCTTAKTA